MTCATSDGGCRDQATCLTLDRCNWPGPVKAAFIAGYDAGYGDGAAATAHMDGPRRFVEWRQANQDRDSQASHGRQSCADVEMALAASCDEVVRLRRIADTALDLATSLWPPGSAERQPAEKALRSALGLPDRPEWSPALSDDDTEREAQLADLRRRRERPHQRSCQGCRTADGEHDFGPTCTIAEQST